MTRLTFQLNYHTIWGHQVCLCGSIPELGNFDESNALALSNDGDTWSAEVDVEKTTDIQYYYFIREGLTTVRREWGKNRKVYITNEHDFFIQDLWKNRPYHAYLYSSLFTDSIFAHGKDASLMKFPSRSVLLNVICPYVSNDQVLVVSGDCDTLGNWDLQHARQLTHVDDGEWEIALDAKDLPEKTFYKFVIVDKTTHEAIHWEDGGNRTLLTEKVQKNNRVLVEMALLFHYQHFAYKGSGTAIPVFSLKTNDSFGVGDFADLRKMIDWIALTGQQLIQVLPVNDTTASKTWRDSYPYSAISIYALHPIYLGCKDFPLRNEKKFNAYIEEAVLLNSLPEMDWERVLKLKGDYSRDLFLQDGEAVLLSEEYKVFYGKNEAWLFPYACYCYLRDKNNSADFREWGEFSRYDEDRLKRMLDIYPEARRELFYCCFLQFLLHKQFSGIKEYAHEKGVALKGDIPIGISRDSIDAWTTPHLFNMDTQTGAPPDDFSIYGQNWGFPTYNWRAMEEEGYAWWINRFRKMADYFDAYRIDHILGFFRIWEIPLDAVQGLLGYFSPALPYWAEEISRAGIPFDEERMVKPFIHTHFLPDIFGNYTEEVKNNYLDVSGWEQFRLKPFCNTQQRIKNLFANHTDAKSRQICDGLLALCTEVLFVRDPQDQHRFHPRITAQYTYSYRYLGDHEKEAFNRLYDEFYYRRHNYFWREQAMKKLPVLISSTSMMVCGEDLGMVPDCVPSVMHELQMLSLEIQRMPKDPRATFTDLRRLPYLSVCTTSTHDMSPIRLWWTENRDITQRYYNEVLHREGAVPAECSTELCRQIIEDHLHSSAMWVILPWQDWTSMDENLRNPDAASERINIPANPEHYWRYRMHLSLDDLLKETAFNEKVETLSRR
jgi:4-alpha-glucanotransferase